jgi:hypothetical protein
MQQAHGETKAMGSGPDSAPEREHANTGTEGSDRQGTTREAATVSHCSGGSRARARRPDGRGSPTANLANLQASVNETNQHGARPCGKRNSADEWGKRARCSGSGRSTQKEQSGHIRRDRCAVEEVTRVHAYTRPTQRGVDGAATGVLRGDVTGATGGVG